MSLEGPSVLDVSPLKQNIKQIICNAKAGIKQFTSAG